MYFRFSSSNVGRLLASVVVATGALVVLVPGHARAQAVVTAVNGDPVTTYDVDEHAKLLKLSRKPASRNDALEDVIADRLKYDEARKWGVDAADSDISSALGRVAAEAKLQPQAWLEAAQRAHIDGETIKAHLRALAAWNVYVRARNKLIGVSEEEISAQLAKKGTNAKITDYLLRQVVFVVPVGASPAVVDSRLKEAQALRNRFTDCNTGLQLARALPDVAVKESMTRESDSLSPALRNLLADTPTGRLTTPERSAAGIELIAVCEKSDSDQMTLRERVQNELITDKLEAESQRTYKQLRAAAVIRKN